MKKTIRIPCLHCKKEENIEVSAEALQRWKNGLLAQEAFPDLSPEQREMFISKICPSCWDKLFGPMEEENPAYSKEKTKDYLFDDAVRMAEFRFRKPYSRFGESEIKYLHRLYNKADDNRLSLKLYPDRGSHNPKKRKKKNPNIKEFMFNLDPSIVPVIDWCAGQYVYRVLSHNPKANKDIHFQELARNHEKHRSKYEKKFTEALSLGMDKELNSAADNVFSEMNTSVAVPKRLHKLAKEIIVENFRAKEDEVEARILRPANRPSYSALSFPINVPNDNYIAFCELVFGLPKIAFSKSNPHSIVKSKEDEAKWRRAIRSTERKFKKKEKNFKDREWRYVVGTFKKMKHI